MDELHESCGAFITNPTTSLLGEVLECLATMGHPVALAPEFCKVLVQELNTFMRVGSSAVVRGPTTLKIVLTQDSQQICEYSLIDVFKQFSTLHVHGPDTPKEKKNGCSCPYHRESLITHLVRAFLLVAECEFAKNPITVYYNEDGSMTDAFRFLFQNAVTALLHDIGKPSTRIVSGQSTAFHTHGEEGSHMLFILYSGAEGRFSRWFSRCEWKLMCDVVQLHMEGCNMTSSEDRGLLLATRLSATDRGPVILESLCCLARVDKASAFPEEAFLTGPIMADCGSILDKVVSLVGDGPGTIREVVKRFGLYGKVIILLDGPSCSGKTTVAKKICVEIESMGAKVAHVSRDNVTETLGGYIAVHADDALKSKIDPTMAKMVEKAFRDKAIVVFDTLQTFFGTSTLNISGAFVVMVSTRRIGLIAYDDANRHHGGDFAAQLKTSGMTSPFDPSPGQRSVPMCLHGKRSVGSSSNLIGALHKGNPVVKFLVPTATEEFHESSLHEVLTHIGHIVTSGIIGQSDPMLEMNLTELITYLSSMFFTDGMSNDQKTMLLTEWFKSHNYTVSTACNRLVYLLRVALFKIHSVPNKAIREVSTDDACYVRTIYGAMAKKDIEDLLREAEACNSAAISIKYKDGPNRDFFAPWHFECRSTTVVFTEHGFYLIPAMQRGAEVLGKTTQDMDNGDTDTFSQEFKHIIHRLNYTEFVSDATDPKAIAEWKTSFEEALAAVSDSVIVTGKRDGSCMRIFVVRVGSHQYNFFIRRLHAAGTEYEKLFSQESLVQSDNKWLMCMASNGTLSTGLMTGYFTTSMMCSDSFEEELSQVSPLDVVSVASHKCSDGMTMFGRFTRKIVNMMHQVEADTDAVTFLFETICPNRTDVFNGAVHTELAVSYTKEEAGVSFLSAVKYVGDKFVCYPHTELDHEFSEPYYWSVPVDTLLKMAGALSDVVIGRMTIEQFLESYPSAGGHGPIDPEGFVAYFTVGDKLIYTKVKTKAYYDLHKLKICNLPWLLGMPESAERFFPNLTVVKNFFNLERQTTFCTELAHYATSEDMMACLAGKALESYRREVAKLDANRCALMNAHAENDLDVIDKLASIVRFQEAGLVKRILGMKESGSVWADKVYRTMTSMFGPVHADYVGSVGGFVKNFFLNEIKIHEAGYLERLAIILEPSNVQRNGLPRCIGEIFMAVLV